MIKRWLRVSPSIPQLHSQDDGRLLAALHGDGTVRVSCLAKEMRWEMMMILDNDGTQRVALVGSKGDKRWQQEG
jgi:hypothetical protein